MQALDDGNSALGAMITRRRFLGSSAGLALGVVAPRLLAQPRARFDRNPFGLGIASGSPTPTGVVLWTRIAPEPLAPAGGVDQATVPVRWEIARDENMRDVVQRGTAAATVDWGYSVHVEVNGLEPNRWYFYRFLVDDGASPIGRTRTALAPDRTLERLRIVVGSCQHYEHGYFGAYRYIAADNPDLIVFLGDYIYETNTADNNIVRRHNAPEPGTLADYRTRYALYRSDPDLQAAHASCPWVVTWDDHEVVNNYANDWALRDNQRERFLHRRAAAY